MYGLVDEWLESGIQKGDTVLIHSSVKRLFKRYLRSGIRLTPEIILESFLEAVGDTGTLLFPLFNFDFTKGIDFDIRHTPSHMGALTEAARKHPNAVRTGHPIYSFAIIGAKADEFKNVNNFSGYGEDSPFALLLQMEGKIAVLDLPDQESMTFVHHVEEMLNVNYRYHKVFTGNYTDKNGETTAKDYGLFVRNIEKGVRTYVDPAGELMWQADLYHGARHNEGSGLRTIRAADMFDFISNIINSDRAEGILFRIEE